MAKKKRKTKLRTELKKTLRGRRKLDTNKLIYAVAAGLAVVLVIFVLVTIGGGSPPNKEKLILDTIDYLKKNTSISDLQAFPEENKALIVYDSSMADESRQKVDFRQMARYAGIRLSNKIEDEEVQILLREIGKKEKDYLVVVKNSSIISETLLE